jgi:hypothetical protein
MQALRRFDRQTRRGLAGSLPHSPAGDLRHFMAPRKKQRLEEAVLRCSPTTCSAARRSASNWPRSGLSTLTQTFFRRACDFISGLARRPSVELVAGD